MDGNNSTIGYIRQSPKGIFCCVTMGDMDMFTRTKEREAFARRLREAKDESKLADFSQEKIAKAFGVTQSLVSAYFSGRKTPSMPVLSNIAKQLGVTADWLHTGRAPKRSADTAIDGTPSITLDDIYHLTEIIDVIDQVSVADGLNLNTKQKAKLAWYVAVDMHHKSVTKDEVKKLARLLIS